ncbi:Hypothetical_protein [Hexamita inflata]|uniref:Hypothetical_protein n=1 Tax=Hexamita inflata TaxID=28002 RepID=A0AA86NNP1_9EUKA|nr:Hypothetical protein HINF_LOCUS10453 [Hexamita inflata]
MLPRPKLRQTKPDLDQIQQHEQKSIEKLDMLQKNLLEQNKPVKASPRRFVQAQQSQQAQLPSKLAEITSPTKTVQNKPYISLKEQIDSLPESLCVLPSRSKSIPTKRITAKYVANNSNFLPSVTSDAKDIPTESFQVPYQTMPLSYQVESPPKIEGTPSHKNFRKLKQNPVSEQPKRQKLEATSDLGIIQFNDNISDISLHDLILD